MKKISIIMPIHNTPFEYLESCLESILFQNLNEYELICINDCSDNVETINCLNNYKNHLPDEKMHVIQMEKNVGAAKARNFGLKIATGEFVIFLDSDDVFRKDMLSIMYEGINNNCADVCICNYRSMHENNSYTYFENTKLNRECEDWICRIPMNPWTKLIRRKYLLEKNIRFQSLTSCNDVYFSIMTLLCTNKIVYLNDKYLVDYRVGTPGNISSFRNPLNIWYAFEKIRNEINTRFNNYNFYTLDVTFLISCVCELNSCIQEENRKQLYEMCKYYFKEKKMEKKILEIQRKCFVELEYETKWFEYIGDYDAQLKYNKDEILKKIGNNELWLFGIGKRGKSFLKLAYENNIKVQGACDKKNDKCGKTINGVRIFNREDVLKKKNIMIIASNNAVFLELREEYNKKNLMNLEKFCPL